MTSFRDSHRIVIAGASSLLGAELKSLLEESRFAAADFRLVDEDPAVGTLTEAGGEAAVIQPVEEDTFGRAQFIFFTGSHNFTLANFELAQRSGAFVIDLSGHSVGFVNSFSWFDCIERLRGDVVRKDVRLATIPSAAAEAIARLALALKVLQPARLTATVLQPVSAAGKPAVEELETQTTQLLSFQPVGKQLFDEQVAFNTLERFGPASRIDLVESRNILGNEVVHTCGPTDFPIATQLLHVPVFYGTSFTICADLAAAADRDAIQAACKSAGFSVTEPAFPPNNVSAAEQTTIQLAPPRKDRGDGIWWFWGAADNIRLPAWNAVKLAEKLLA